MASTASISPRPFVAAQLARRAFSLIEAALVLLVVGLVIGGIWMAADAVGRNRRHSLYQSVLVEAQQRFNSMYSSSRLPNPGTWALYDLVPSLYPDMPRAAVSTTPISFMSSSGYIYATSSLVAYPDFYLGFTYQFNPGSGLDYIVLIIGPMDEPDCFWIGKNYRKFINYRADGQSSFRNYTATTNYATNWFLLTDAALSTACKPVGNVLVLYLRRE